MDSVLGDSGYVKLGADWAIWVNGDTGAIIAAHVDGMTACGTEKQLEEAKQKIGLVLGVKDLGNITRCLNITCTYDDDAANAQFYLSQPDYIKRLLEEYGMQQLYDVSTPALESDRERWENKELPLFDDRNKKKYQALVGCLLYLMHATRPDIVYTIIRLSKCSAYPRSPHCEGLKRILRYLKGTKDTVLALGGGTKDNSLVGYINAAHADNASGRSTCCYLFLWDGSPMSWCSKAQRTVALSTTEAEFMAGTEATKEAVWILALLR